MKVLKLFVLLVLLGIGMGGCETTGDKDPIGMEGDAGRRAGSDAEGAATQGLSGGSDISGTETKGLGASDLGSEPWNDPGSPLSNRIIYFNFDSSSVSSEYRSVIAQHAEFLAINPELNVILEGHADERGSREYNIALGEQRAKAIARMMKLQGVSQSQIRTLSYGEEKPDALGHDEESWRLNRRVELAYPGN